VDTVDITLFAIAVLPWVAYLFKSIELPGGVKLELQEIRRELELTSGKADSASTQATAALASSTKRNEQPTQVAQSASAATQLADLIAQYDHIRATQSSGQARTDAMTEIVQRMINLAPDVKDFDVANALFSEQRGTRLAAYSFLWALPNRDLLDQLVESVTNREDKPFGQYWGILAMRRLLGSDSSLHLSNKQRTSLLTFLQQLPRRSDRYAELLPLLGRLDRER
jgi:hypothetical protein